MLLTLLFHQIHPANPKLLEAKLEFLKRQYPLLLPGEKIAPFKTSLCLTFDDAYFDFYYYLFPLLQKLKIKALLAVPAGYILEKATASSNERLQLVQSHKNFFQKLQNETESNTKYKNAFCSFEELKIMAQSGLVEVASHSFSHPDLTKKAVELKQEITLSKNILESKLNCPIKTFVYPYGRFNLKVHAYVKKHYQYILRIGSAINFSWQNLSRLTYRQNIISFNDLELILSYKHLLSQLSSWFVNTIRKR